MKPYCAWKFSILSAAIVFIFISLLQVEADDEAPSSSPCSWSYPSNLIDTIDSTGNYFARYYLSEVNVPGKAPIPLFLDFSSSPTQKSELFGRGWRCSIIDSQCWFSSENTLAIILPDGHMVSTDVGNDRNMPKTDGTWSKIVFTDSELILTDHCGQSFTYKKGKLASIAFDENNVLCIEPHDDSVDLVLNGHTTHQIKFDRISGLATSLECPDCKWLFTQDSWPEVQPVQNVKLVSRMAPSTVKLQKEGDTGQTSLLKLTLDGAMNCVMNIDSKGEHHKAIWDSTTGTVQSVDSYSFHTVTDQGLQVNEVTDSNGKVVSSGNSYDKGLQTTENNGTITKTHYFTSGILADKARSIEVDTGGKQVSNSRYIYDDKGSLIRILSGNNTFNVEYNATSIVIKQNGNVIRTYSYGSGDSLALSNEEAKQ